MEQPTSNSLRKTTKPLRKQPGVLFTVRLKRELAAKIKKAAQAERRSASNFGAFLLESGFSNLIPNGGARMTPARPASATRRATKKRGAQTNLNHA